jgi:uncharacterized cupin superfamily protein
VSRSFRFLATIHASWHELRLAALPFILHCLKLTALHSPSLDLLLRHTCAFLAVAMQANAAEYSKIDITRPLRQQPAGKVVLEYPTLLVLLPHEKERYCIVAPPEGEGSGEQGREAGAAARQGEEGTLVARAAAAVAAAAAAMGGWEETAAFLQEMQYLTPAAGKEIITSAGDLFVAAAASAKGSRNKTSTRLTTTQSRLDGISQSSVLLWTNRMGRRCLVSTTACRALLCTTTLGRRPELWTLVLTNILAEIIALHHMTALLLRQYPAS